VHSSEPGSATQKAVELVKMAIARARLLSPLTGESLEINQQGLVIGGGLSGLTAALALANQDFRVHLVEKENKLGGHMMEARSTLERGDIDAFRENLISAVTSHSNITLHLETRVTAVQGHIGKFDVKLGAAAGGSEVSCGAIVVATGAEGAEASGYLYGEAENVVTQSELEQRLAREGPGRPGQTTVMIQCVGSRDEEREFCSRVCCSMAIKNALMIKETDPDARVFVLYRDIRTYGFREIYYKKAREAGVIFIRYEPEKAPEVRQAEGLVVHVESPDFPEAIEIETDLVALSTGIVPRLENSQTAALLKVPLNADGFFLEAHVKLRPVDFATEGIFLCGLAHSPKFMDENISQAKAAAARAATVLSRTHLDVGALVSRVDQNKCISCMTCIHACPYGAPFVNVDKKAEIAGAKCMGCGICASECPARAIQLNHFEADQFNVMLDDLFHVKTELMN
jgi:heterodisulfide reductase subunit A